MLLALMFLVGAAPIGAQEAFQQEIAFVESQLALVEAEQQALLARGTKSRSDAQAAIGTADAQLALMRTQLAAQESALQEAANARQRTSPVVDVARLAELGSLAPAVSVPHDFASALAMFEAINAELTLRARVKVQHRDVFDLDGQQQSVAVVALGDAAQFAVDEKLAGALAPTGGRQWQVWSADTALASSWRNAPVWPVVLTKDHHAPFAPVATLSVWRRIVQVGPLAYVVALFAATSLALALWRVARLTRIAFSFKHACDDVLGGLSRGQRAATLSRCMQRNDAASGVLAALLRAPDAVAAQATAPDLIAHTGNDLRRFHALALAAAALLLGVAFSAIGYLFFVAAGRGDGLSSAVLAEVLATASVLVVVAAAAAAVVGVAVFVAAELERAAMHTLERAALQVLAQPEDVGPALVRVTSEQAA